jgi:hypothetical protein
VFKNLAVRTVTTGLQGIQFLHRQISFSIKYRKQTLAAQLPQSVSAYRHPEQRCLASTLTDSGE